MCEHLQKLHNAGSRPQAQFFNTLLDIARRVLLDFFSPII